MDGEIKDCFKREKELRGDGKEENVEFLFKMADARTRTHARTHTPSGFT